MAILPALEEACAAYLVCDAALSITTSSRNIAEALDTPDLPLIGRQLFAALPSLSPYHEQIQAVLAGTAAQVVAEQIELHLHHCNASTCLITVHVLPFNDALLIYIQRAHNQIRLQAHIQQQYDELQQLHSQLTIRNEELLVRSQRMAELLSLVVHELDERLTSIAERMRSLLDPANEQQDQQAALRLLEQAVAQTLVIVHGAIDFEQVAAFGATTRYPVELDLLVQQVVQAFQPYAAQQGVRVLYDRDGAAEQTFEPLLVVMGNANVLQQAITHLVSSSMRFMVSGCALVLRLKLLHDLPALEPPLDALYDWCLLEVEDNGLGIPTEQLARLATGGSLQGALLGLMVAQQAIQQHGGRLKIDSHPGSGTLMQVYLPCERDGAVGSG